MRETACECYETVKEQHGHLLSPAPDLHSQSNINLTTLLAWFFSGFRPLRFGLRVADGFCQHLSQLALGLSRWSRSRLILGHGFADLCCSLMLPTLTGGAAEGSSRNDSDGVSVGTSLAHCSVRRRLSSTEEPSSAISALGWAARSRLALAPKGYRVSINPDAHSIRELDHMHWGAEMARKEGVPPDRILNAMPLQKLLGHLQNRRQTAARAA